MTTDRDVDPWSIPTVDETVITGSEAAAREAALFYSRPAGDGSVALRAAARLADELALVDALAREDLRRGRSLLLADIRAGIPTSQVMQLHRVSYETVAMVKSCAA